MKKFIKIVAIIVLIIIMMGVGVFIYIDRKVTRIMIEMARMHDLEMARMQELHSLNNTDTSTAVDSSEIGHGTVSDNDIPSDNIKDISQAQVSENTVIQGITTQNNISQDTTLETEIEQGVNQQNQNKQVTNEQNSHEQATVAPKKEVHNKKDVSTSKRKEPTFEEKMAAYDLAMSKLTTAQIDRLYEMAAGGFTPEEKKEAKDMFYSNFTKEEQEWILEMYRKYY